MRILTARILAVLLIASLFLMTACNGDGGEVAPAEPEPPSAEESVVTPTALVEDTEIITSK